MAAAKTCTPALVTLDLTYFLSPSKEAGGVHEGLTHPKIVPPSMNSCHNAASSDDHARLCLLQQARIQVRTYLILQHLLRQNQVLLQLVAKLILCLILDLLARA